MIYGTKITKSLGERYKGNTRHGGTPYLRVGHVSTQSPYNTRPDEVSRQEIPSQRNVHSSKQRNIKTEISIIS